VTLSTPFSPLPTLPAYQNAFAPKLVASRFVNVPVTSTPFRAALVGSVESYYSTVYVRAVKAITTSTYKSPSMKQGGVILLLWLQTTAPGPDVQ